ncbi:hypothetical protein [Litorihabitans aurantiacus]|uniref:GGDEF domain-containing protein n=1 Tax=Litorihabitans aurantiacus TaxID=1930061 RepID=A0AA37ULW2_9MICO|nr:hypothetical protein [Litorihabitans aurantiacus]GMA30439.1 hypothetical protein GCM10025875_04310 [Litorihabitans aurantiacus]
MTILRGPLRAQPAMVALGGVAGVFGLFQVTRITVAGVAGFDSPLFLEWFGSEIATIVGTLVALVGSFAMTAARAPEGVHERAGQLRFDPYHGLRTPAWLARRADLDTDRAAESGLPSSVVLVRVRDLDEIAAGFGRPLALEAFERVAEEVVAGVPRDVLAGTVPHVPATIVIVAPGADETAVLELVGMLEQYLRAISVREGEVELPVLCDLTPATGSTSWRRLVSQAAAEADAAQASRSTT